MRARIALTLLLALLAGAFGASAASDEVATEEVGVLETSMGTMVFRFFDSAAPLTTANFKQLVGEGFYDGLKFYRVVKGHVIQTGDGGESGRPTVKGEFGAHPHVTGAVGLARGADPDSGSTEIYICHEPRPHLDGSYAIFGLLVEGFEVLEAIANVAVEAQWAGRVAFHKPLQPVIIERAYIERRALPAE
jgi:cyclophilin family peptidyl-prolyl cis-trans isomerase